MSELALYDFNKIHRTGHSNLVVDALIYQPQDPNSDNEITNDEQEWTAISYQTVCETQDIGIDGTKLDHTLNLDLHTSS